MQSRPIADLLGDWPDIAPVMECRTVSGALLSLMLVLPLLVALVWFRLAGTKGE